MKKPDGLAIEIWVKVLESYVAGLTRSKETLAVAYREACAELVVLRARVEWWEKQ